MAKDFASTAGGATVKVRVLRPEYVEHLPETLEEGILYVCEEFSLTAHKCCCGCGEDVHNKLGPAKWSLIKHSDGRVSLDPSVGNWKYACRSHYWICENEVLKAGPMSSRAIKAVQARDRQDRAKYIARVNAAADRADRRSAGTVSVVRAMIAHALTSLRRLWPW